MIKILAMEKHNLRNELRIKRQCISIKERKNATKIINRLLIKLLKNRVKIAIYQKMGSELDLTAFITAYQKSTRASLYQPLYKKWTKRMWFIKLNAHQQQKLRIEQLDYVIVPLIGIDYRGYRIGQGGGYYDASLKHTLLNKKPYKIAIGFDCQLIEEIPIESHDIKMNAFISEKRVIKFN